VEERSAAARHQAGLLLSGVPYARPVLNTPVSTLINTYTALTDVSVYPTQLDAFIAAYRYLLSLDIPPGRIVFMGDSAGGGLSVLCGVRLQNLGLPQPASYILISPWLDHSGENFEGGCPMVETDYLIYANEMVPHFSRLWCGPYPGDAPDVNPLYLAPEARQRTFPSVSPCRRSGICCE
jgi:acetyl esterase/lipase